MKRKLINLFLAAILVLGVAIVPANGNAVQAASSMNKAKTIYKKILKKEKVPYKDNDGVHSVTIKSFYLLDIDKNGIPELIVKDAPADESFSTRYIYTVKNGKLAYCGEYYQRGQAQLQYSVKYKSIYHWWWTNGVGGAGSILYKLKNYKMKEYKYMYTSMESPTSDKVEYWYGSTSKTANKVSKKKFNVMDKKYCGKIELYDFYDNTPSNIRKVLNKSR